MILKAHVRSLQPGCLISARIGHGLGDIIGYGDQEMPSGPVGRPAEACVSMNDTWGYKHDGGRWKSGDELLALRRMAARRGCNLLLNIGPMADGRFPPEAYDRMRILKEHK